MLSWLMSFGRSQDGITPGSHYIAVGSILNGLTGLLAGGVVAWTVKKLGTDWAGSVWGIPLTYHAVLMLISIVLRLATLGWLIPWSAPGSGFSKSLREAPGFFAAEAWRQLCVPVAYIGRWLGVSTRNAVAAETGS